MVNASIMYDLNDMRALTRGQGICGLFGNSQRVFHIDGLLIGSAAQAGCLYEQPSCSKIQSSREQSQDAIKNNKQPVSNMLKKFIDNALIPIVFIFSWLAAFATISSRYGVYVFGSFCIFWISVTALAILLK